MLDTEGYKHTLRICNICYFSTTTIVAWTRPNVLLQVCISTNLILNTNRLCVCVCKCSSSTLQQVVQIALKGWTTHRTNYIDSETWWYRMIMEWLLHQHQVLSNNSRRITWPCRPEFILSVSYWPCSADVRINNSDVGNVWKICTRRLSNGSHLAWNSAQQRATRTAWNLV